MAESSQGKIAGRKRKKNYYVKSAKRGPKRELCPGMKGILITCSGNERMCVREAYDLLNEVAESIYGPENTHGQSGGDKKGDSSSSSNEEDCCDIEKKIEQEVNVLKEVKERRFQSLFSGAKSLIFIKCSDEVDPNRLVHQLLSDAKGSGVQKTRFCSRFIPVSKICSASLKEIKKHAFPVIAEHFHGVDPKPVEFAVHYKCRNNSVIERKDVIDLMASIVTGDSAYPHIVNLNSPELVVSVLIIKGYCCISILKDFFTLKQYNIQSLYSIQKDETSTKQNASLPKPEKDNSEVQQ